eukprot:scaffold3801_cov255-Alexandrium_tamarense.AAC.2
MADKESQSPSEILLIGNRRAWWLCEGDCELFECRGERGPADSSETALMAKPVVGVLDKNYGSRYARVALRSHTILDRNRTL